MSSFSAVNNQHIELCLCVKELYYEDIMTILSDFFMELKLPKNICFKQISRPENIIFAFYIKHQQHYCVSDNYTIYDTITIDFHFDILIPFINYSPVSDAYSILDKIKIKKEYLNYVKNRNYNYNRDSSILKEEYEYMKKLELS